MSGLCLRVPRIFSAFLSRRNETVRGATAVSSGADSVDVDYSEPSQLPPSMMTMWREVSQDEIRSIRFTRVVLTGPVTNVCPP